MSDDAHFTEKQHAALKDILVGWSDLSRGDISIICENWRKPGEVWTTGGTPHARFWRNLVYLGWAEPLYSLIDPATVPVEPLSFRLTDEGHHYLPRFLLFYDLLHMGACTPAVDKAAFLKRQGQTAQPAERKEWLPSRRRLIPALAMVLAGLWLTYRGANPLLCFFLLTYSGVAALLLHADIFKGSCGKILRGVASLNALFLAGSILPLLFH
jgi:hypothetical protein